MSAKISDVGSESSDRAEQSAGENGDGVSVNAPVVVPPSYDDRPLEPGQTAGQTLPNGLPALSASKGLKLESLFSEEIKDADERMKRLENAHLDFRKEYEQIKPAILRLAAIESDLQTLMRELNGFVEQQAQAAPVESVEEEAEETLTEADKETAPEEPAPPPPPQEAFESQLKGIRIGNHPDKVRIVLDIKGLIAKTVTLADNALSVELQATDLDPALKTEQSLQKNALLDSYAVMQEGAVAKLTFTLRQSTQIMGQEALEPKSPAELSRLVFDLKR